MQMETTTPTAENPGRSDRLSSLTRPVFCLDNVMADDEDDITWGHTSSPKEPSRISNYEFEDDDDDWHHDIDPAINHADDPDQPDPEHDDEVCPRICSCQAPPENLPPGYTPRCLPQGVRVSSREIQMYACFKDNLLQTRQAPAKTQTCRAWCVKRACEHKRAFLEGKWIRVWRGQGHKSTIGWMLITVWDEVMVGDLDKGDCAREGRPGWEPKKLKDTFFKSLKPDDVMTRIRFTFQPCRVYV
jgi:hypothetical protein